MDLESDAQIRPLDYVTHIDSTPVTDLVSRYKTTLFDYVRQNNGKRAEVDICRNKKHIQHFDRIKKGKLTCF